MAASPTVENYLKAILQAQTAGDTPALVPMGQLAAALGVTPGTATTMVKTLAESGLVRYEPYVGVRLTKAGEKLAALVLRRHRLIELFLVNVMGMSWAEVHDEAEHLEHAVSDRLIELMDEMLGRPSADPHGDPIPDADGTVTRPEYDTLMTCPLHEPVTIRRVTDQDSEFLRFVERHDLKPGQRVSVEERDAAADSVRLRGRGRREITIGARAASKVLVQAIGVVCLWIASAVGASAQTPPVEEPFDITDNSFLVEEAFNQEPGTFQNIVNWMHQDGDWFLTFTQEWPVTGVRHQVSYTIPFSSMGGAEGLGDTLVNYRLQLLEEGPGRPAFSPRLSAIVPTARTDRSTGLQFNLPFSKQRDDLYFHWNGGMTWTHRSNRPNLVVPQLAGSAIYRAAPMLHVMLESVLTFDQQEVVRDGRRATERDRTFVLAPGVRGGWNLAADTQIIIGAAVPISWTAGSSSAGILAYFSYEAPFKK
ncbi:MAG: metal-dependent transcriptional regulator [Acidobacteria bacterium]|nr:metal-dependent transcriptional regulator [Acidobacteriota bacterium]